MGGTIKEVKGERFSTNVLPSCVSVYSIFTFLELLVCLIGFNEAF